MKNKLIEFLWFVRDLFRNRQLIVELSTNDFKTKYAGSVFGIVWGFVKPTVTIGVFWFVFEVGFKSRPIEDFPFILWLMAGLIPWFFFNEAWLGATNCLYEYSYLVKKVVFRVSVLPLVKIFSAFYINVFFIVLLVSMFFFYGFPYDAHYIQIFYYLISMFILLMGLSLLTSSIAVLYKDVSQLIEVLLQVGFWLTPIFCNYNILDDRMSKILSFNPMFYIVQGYRDSLINKIWFFEKPIETGIFWITNIVLFVTGSFIFRKLRSHFADVL